MYHVHVYPDKVMGEKFIAPFAAAMADGCDAILFGPVCNSEIRLTRVEAKTKLARSPTSYIKTAFNLVRYVRERRSPVVFLHSSVDSCGFAAALKLLTRSTVVYVNHGVPYLGYKGVRRLMLRAIERVNLWACDVAVAINQDMAVALASVSNSKEIVALTPGTLVGIQIPPVAWEEVERQKMESRRVLQNIIPYEDALIILYVGRLVSRKGLDHVLTSSKRSKARVHVVVCGTGKPSQSLDDNRVAYLGHLSEEQLNFWYLAADLLCVPSHHEGMGQVYLEAATRGTPSISADIPGPRTFVDNFSNGYRVDPGNEEQLANLLDQVSQNRDELRARGRNAFKSVASFARDRVLEGNVAAVHQAVRNLKK